MHAKSETRNFMKRIILLFLFSAIIGAAFGQKLTVESFDVAPMDLSASTSPRLDLNKQPCAPLRISIPACCGLGGEVDANLIF